MTDWLKSLLERSAPQESKTEWPNGRLPMFVYGTGTMAQDVHRVLTDRGFPVNGFIDHLEHEFPLLNGMPIFDPEQAAASSKTKHEAVVVLGIHNNQANIPQIVQRLNNAGFTRIVSPIELYDHFGEVLGVRYWLTSRDFYWPLQTILEETLSLWADETSRSLFRSILEFRLSGDASVLPAPDLVNQYHPLDLPAWQTPLRFVDCGAFDGDTLADFIQNKIKLEAVAAFEPDLSNFAKLSHFVSAKKNQLQSASLWPCGAYSSTTQLTFETGKGMASNISNAGKSVIQCVALDDALPTFVPNLIKMDIEGAEYNALLGARNLISTHTPGLAISLYHRPEHLWQLPLLVECMAPGKYHFFVRSHALNDFDLVLYAIPTDPKR